jgi:hypothetical protein
MKKIAPYVVVFLAALLLLNVFDSAHNTHFNIDGDEFDGPLGALFGVLFGGAGMLIGALVMVLVAAVLAVVFAGVGVLVVVALALGFVVVVAAMSPLLLPLLIPVGIFWLLTRRSRRERSKAEAV